MQKLTDIWKDEIEKLKIEINIKKRKLIIINKKGEEEKSKIRGK